MQLNRFVWAVGLIIASGSGAWASARPKPLQTAQVEARNETAAPSFTGQVREAHRITRFLNDALVLNNAQRHAVEGYTVAEREALALAATPTDLASARQAYLQAVHRVLAISQLHAYAALRQRLADTTLSLDGTELALR